MLVLGPGDIEALQVLKLPIALLVRDASPKQRASDGAHAQVT